MQFIANGPEVPNDLLEAQEDGRVVFFCGAGVSQNADLPNFEGLTSQIFSKTELMSGSEKALFDKKEYDLALDSLEFRLRNRLITREKLSEILECKRLTKKQKSLHDSIVKLSVNDQGSLKLITTNYDSIFNKVLKLNKIKTRDYVAPSLPLVNDDLWDGLVYLHGKLPDSETDTTSLQNLILTSGDFGRAYLTDGWASKFLKDLFHRYIVCFVGYSLEDKIVRYIMDALSADRSLGNSNMPIYAFVGSNPKNYEQAGADWELKKVKPILYDCSKGHSHLVKSFRRWAELSEAGMTSKKAILAKYASFNPQKSTSQDDFVGRVQWAISDTSGIPSEFFAKIEPTPHLTWLDVFDRPLVDGEECNLVRKIPTSSEAKRMSLVHFFGEDTSLDEVTNNIGHWLSLHMTNPNLVHWVISKGGCLNKRFKDILSRSYEKTFNSKEKIETNIPYRALEIAWSIILRNLNHKSKNFYGYSDIYNKISDGQYNIADKEYFFETLTPKVKLKEPFRYGEESNFENYTLNTPFSSVFSWEIHPDKNISWSLKEIEVPTNGMKSFFVQYFDEFNNLVNRYFDLIAYLSESREMYSLVAIPSVEHHWQNHGYYDWTKCVFLLKSAWLELYKKAPLKSLEIAKSWLKSNHMTFHRLALFSFKSANSEYISVWFKELKNFTSLFGEQFYRREVCRLLATHSGHFSDNQLKTLDKNIWRQTDKYQLRDATFIRWLYLSKLKSEERTLSKKSERMILQYTGYNDSYQIKEHEREEFVCWTSGTGSPDYKQPTITKINNNLDELIKHISENPSGYHDYSPIDNWNELSIEYPNDCLNALMYVYSDGKDYSDRVTSLLNNWSNNLRQNSDKMDTTKELTSGLINLIKSLPYENLIKVFNPFCSWISTVTARTNFLDSNNISEIHEWLKTKYQSSYDSYSYQNCINHPFGKLAESLINLYFKVERTDNDGLDAEYQDVFNFIMESSNSELVFAKNILLSNVIAFMRIDKQWAESKLIACFKWENNQFAKYSWDAFFISPRFNFDFHELVAPDFWKAYNNIHLFENDIQRVMLQYLGNFLFSEVSLDSGDAISKVVKSLDDNQLESLIQQISVNIEAKSSLDLKQINDIFVKLPKEKIKDNTDASNAIALLCLCKVEFFDKLFIVLKSILRKVQYVGYVLYQLKDSAHASQFPEQTLEFLEKVLSSDNRNTELKDVLNKIDSSTLNRKHKRIFDKLMDQV